MKNKTNTLTKLDTNNPIEFTLQAPELPHFTITGSFEDIVPVYTDIEQRISTYKPAKIAAVVLEAPQPTHDNVEDYLPPLASGPAVELRTFVWDALHGTSFRHELHKQRQDRRDLRFAQELGIVGATRCARHEAALRKLHSLQ
jgi:hypothetical protein